jgi:hypothetical protein
MAHNLHLSSIVDMKKHPTIRDVITKGTRSQCRRDRITNNPEDEWRFPFRALLHLNCDNVTPKPPESSRMRTLN